MNGQRHPKARAAFLKLLSKPIDFILGGDASPLPSPARLRNEALVGFLVFIEPVIFISVAADVDSGIGVFTMSRLAVGLVIMAGFALMASGRVGAGFDTIFFGCTACLLTGFVLVADVPGLAGEMYPLVIMVLFAALVLYGVYAEDFGRVRYLFAAALVFDVWEYFVLRSRGQNLIHSRLGVLVLHGIALGLAAFLRSYFERLSNIAEARRRMNRRLEEILAEVQASGVERLESLSHDIRSPITGILGVHDLLASTKLDAEQRGYLRILERSNRLLLEIAESILATDEETMRAAVDQPSMRDLLDDALAPYGPTAKARGLTLKKRVLGNPPALPLSRADAARVVGNLVDNALKYTVSGRVVVQARASVDFDGVDVTVSDTGLGMSPERLAAVRAGAVDADQAMAGSHGLGLAGVRRLVEDRGGVVLIDSQKGKGTRITLRFPLPERTP